MIVATESRDENPTQARNLNKVETRLTVSLFKTCTASSVYKKRSDDQPYDRASEVCRGQHVRSQNDIYSEEIMCDQFDLQDVR